MSVQEFRARGSAVCGWKSGIVTARVDQFVEGRDRSFLIPQRCDCASGVAVESIFSAARLWIQVAKKFQKRADPLKTLTGLVNAELPGNERSFKFADSTGDLFVLNPSSGRERSLGQIYTVSHVQQRTIAEDSIRRTVLQDKRNCS